MFPSAVCVVFILFAQFASFSPVNALSTSATSGSAFSGEDVPMQLIYPDHNHVNLFLNEETLAMLKGLNMPLAIVGVVGPFHSGKSYLTNQLLNRTNGFQIGTTVNPQTRGLWLWGKPVIQERDGEEMAVLFIDSEGLSASNVTQAYDAKIFAISALLSSLLVYNTVSNVNQAYLDYIEILARRAQLFSMKVAMKNAAQQKTSDDQPSVASDDRTAKPQALPTGSAADVMAFPPLLWVIQDFVLEMEDGVTPTQWLHSILKTPNREGKTSTINEIFDTIECQPLFYPVSASSDIKALRHLDQVARKDLNDEYLKEMDALRVRVLKNVALKTRGGMKVTGPFLALLLETLVAGANAGEFPHVPSVWTSFVRLAVAEAEMNVMAHIEKKYRREFEEHVFSEGEVAAKAQEMQDLLMSQFRAVLPGVRMESVDTTKLIESFNRFKTSLSDQNKRRIDAELRAAMESMNKANKAVNEKLPMLATELKELIDKELAAAVSLFEQQNSRFQDSEKFGYYSRMLQSTLRSEYERVALLNQERLMALLQDARVQAREAFVDAIKGKLVEPLSPKVLSDLKDQATQASLDLFHAKSLLGTDENARKRDLEFATETKRFLVLLNKEIRDAYKEFEVLNERKIYATISRTGGLDNIKRDFRFSLDSIALPLVKELITGEIHQSVSHARDAYAAKNERFRDSESYKQCAKELEDLFEVESNHLLKKNEDQMFLFTRALAGLNVRLLADSDEYYLDWSFKRHAFDLVLAELADVIKDEKLRGETAQLIVYKANRNEKEDIMPRQKFFITFTHIAIAVLAIVVSTGYLMFKRS